MNPLKPVRFYGNALPRPRYYDAGSKGRTEPLPPVNDALLRWAADANWSMGGISSKRQRMQGKIEGRLRKLKDDSEDDAPHPHTSRRSGRRGTSKRVLSDPESEARSGDDGVETLSPKQTSQWGEEDGPSPLRKPLRARGRNSSKPSATSLPSEVDRPVSVDPSPLRTSSRTRGCSSSKPSAASLPSEVDRPVSVDVAARRRHAERSVVDSENSDSDVNREEFIRRKQPLRTVRGTKTRRGIKEFVSADS